MFSHDQFNCSSGKCIVERRYDRSEHSWITVLLQEINRELLRCDCTGSQLIDIAGFINPPHGNFNCSHKWIS